MSGQLSLLQVSLILSPSLVSFLITALPVSDVAITMLLSRRSLVWLTSKRSFSKMPSSLNSHPAIEAKIALKYLNECLSKDVPIHGVALKDGEMLIVENGTTLHGRSEFEGDRWVQRMNLTNSILDKRNNER